MATRRIILLLDPVTDQTLAYCFLEEFPDIHKRYPLIKFIPGVDLGVTGLENALRIDRASLDNDPAMTHYLDSIVSTIGERRGHKLAEEMAVRMTNKVGEAIEGRGITEILKGIDISQLRNVVGAMRKKK